MKKRYVAFLGNIYYPSGGMHDLLGSYDDIDDAKHAIDSKVRDGYCSSFHGDLDAYLEHEWRARKWGHIYDTETNKIVWEK